MRPLLLLLLLLLGDTIEVPWAHGECTNLRNAQHEGAERDTDTTHVRLAQNRIGVLVQALEVSLPHQPEKIRPKFLGRALEVYCGHP